MEQRVSLITLGVRDLAVSKRFYTEVLGWKAAQSPPEIAFFDLGGVVFSLYPHEELAKDLNAAAPAQDKYHGFALAHNVRSTEEVDSLFVHLTAKGVTILKEPEKAFWGGYSGYFADPDGHSWEVAYNPFWTIKDDGRIQMDRPSSED